MMDNVEDILERWQEEMVEDLAQDKANEYFGWWVIDNLANLHQNKTLVELVDEWTRMTPEGIAWRHKAEDRYVDQWRGRQ